MTFLKDGLRQLQNKPYEERVRLLWKVVGGAALLVIAIWIMTIFFREGPAQSGGAEAEFKEIFQNIKGFGK